MARVRTPTGRVTNPAVLAPYIAADLPDAEFASRIATVREGMRLRGHSALLVANPEDIYYLVGLNHQGYFSFTLLVLPVERPPMIVARSMEQPTLDVQLPDCDRMLYDDGTDPGEATVRALARTTEPGEIVGVSRATMFFPITVWEYVRRTLADREWEDASGIVENARSVKSPAEIGLVRKAATITDRAVRAGIAAAGPARTERAVAAAVYHEMVLAGSEHPGFAPFVRSSDILQHEHVTWRDRALVPGTALLMELSGCVYRYHAPASRMAYVGEPPPEAAAAARTALAGMEAVEQALRPGVLSGQVYAAWQAAVDEELGHDRYRRHHCGYAVGIGFPPSWVGGSSVVGLRPGSALLIAEGMVFHVLSWILGQFAVDFCVSDTFLVTEQGCEVLTTTERWPIVVPDAVPAVPS